MIPQLTAAALQPLESTRLYVGRPTLPALDESPSVGRYLGWSSEQILQAAERGRENGDDLGAAMVEVVCTAYVSLVQDSGPRDEELRQLRVELVAERAQLAAGRAQLEATAEQLAAERTQLLAERQLNARLRYELAELTGDTLVVAL